MAVNNTVNATVYISINISFYACVLMYLRKVRTTLKKLRFRLEVNRTLNS